MGEAYLASQTKITGSGSHGVILGVDITETSNGKATVRYTDDLEGMTPCSFDSNGDIISTHAVLQKIKEVCNFRTVHVAAGSNTIYKTLNPDNWGVYTDGASAASNTAGTTYNTFTDFPHFWVKISKSGSTLSIRASNKKVDDDYSDWLFSFNGTVKASRRIGSFLGYVTSNKLYSSASKDPTVSTTLANFRAYARAHGNYYDLWSYQGYTILAIMYLFAFCNIDSQATVCPGLSGGSAKANTGISYNSHGDFYRNGTSNTSRFRIFGIEDVWGNLWQYITNIFTVGSVLHVTDYNTADQAGHDLTTMTFSANYGNCVTAMVGTQYLPFVVKEGGVVSDSNYQTGYCDYGDVGSGYVAGSGGAWAAGGLCGAFCLPVDASASGHAGSGSRLEMVSPEDYEEAA